MKNEIIKASKGVFKPPVKTYYFGKAKFGTPYFDPINYVGSIIRVRKLEKRSPKEVEKRNEQYGHLKNNPNNLYKNYPIVRRAKNKIVNIFGNNYYITFGKPWSVEFHELGWKDKFESPRFEWSPQFAIYFFGFQFIIWWNAPKLEAEKYADNDKYYEMMISFVKYSDKNLDKAKNERGWEDYKTKLSTWDDNYLL